MAKSFQDKAKSLILLRERRIREARKSLWAFCKLLSPDFYKDSRPHLKELCDTLQSVHQGDLLMPDGEPYRHLMINVFPRCGKSRTITHFVAWAFGKNVEERVITCSYAKKLATDFSRYTRNMVAQDKNLPHEIVYNDIFPKTIVNKNNSAVEMWALAGQYFSYKAASVTSGITGSGASLIITDDLVADAETAHNVLALDNIWDWYNNTFLSRKENKCLEIMIMTRWSKFDPCGRILESADASKWFVLKMEAYDEEKDEMLCPTILDKDEYMFKKRNMSDEIFMANYHQISIDVKGRLYSYLTEYTSLPDKTEHIYARIDTADMGKDYTCCVVYKQCKGKAYVIDVYYSKSPMEITEPAIAKMLSKNNVQECVVESNNGGRGFARNLKKILYEDIRYHGITIVAKHQSKNKEARILSNATNVMNSVIFPEGWKQRWFPFYNELMSYNKEGKNRNDDAVDTCTSIAEALLMLNKPIFLGRKNRIRFVMD